MAAKTRSRRIRDQRKHLRAMGILLIVMAVFCVTAVGSLQLKQKNQTYQDREAALEKILPYQQGDFEKLYVRGSGGQADDRSLSGSAAS